MAIPNQTINMTYVITDNKEVNTIEFCDNKFNTIETLKPLTGKESCQKFLKSNETRILLSRIGETNEISTTKDVTFIVQFIRDRIVIKKDTSIDNKYYYNYYCDFKNLIEFIANKTGMDLVHCTMRAYEIYKNAFGESDELTIWFTARMAVAGVFEQ